jgi:hypothetical protein
LGDGKVHPDGVRIAWELGKSLFSGRIEIQGVPKFCFGKIPFTDDFRRDEEPYL